MDGNPAMWRNPKKIKITAESNRKDEMSERKSKITTTKNNEFCLIKLSKFEI